MALSSCASVHQTILCVLGAIMFSVPAFSGTEIRRNTYSAADYVQHILYSVQEMWVAMQSDPVGLSYKDTVE